ncbi:MAG: flavodoxin-dependent (E)-4-hydroxy-3-methylbut-2-enyl-diphosphate synthase [Oscillospiraceae bacterium]|jgi:(E)-4-hydroxy-3-methylbut-2-enyl-diphosphate synthase|nr:flavodoxin-dependent (E)-4-hydroxy-3-methylbut-2-enyl-diphosphate synthase [Oscillospiraceae bacterium]
MTREKTRKIKLGGLYVGGDAPVSVQSMCTVKTSNVTAVLAQILELAQAGCEIVRLAVPDEASAKALPAIRAGTSLPLVADVHFDYRLAIAAMEAGFDAVRINPGNIGSRDKVKLVARACLANGTAIRVGVNGGSLERGLLEEFGSLPEVLAESALRQIELLESFGLRDICASVKCSNAPDTVAAYRRLAERTDCPLHLGLTEAGGAYMGTIKSSAAIGALLLDGIGSTIRVSLTADPVEEVRAGLALLKAVGLRREGVELISCPTCGRTGIDLIAAARSVEQLLRDVKTPLTVAVMGCAVNGPGEARHADFGLAGGAGEGVLFRRGEIVGKAPEEELVGALVELIHREIQ